MDGVASTPRVSNVHGDPCAANVHIPTVGISTTALRAMADAHARVSGRCVVGFVHTLPSIGIRTRAMDNRPLFEDALGDK